MQINAIMYPSRHNKGLLNSYPFKRPIKSLLTTS